MVEIAIAYQGKLRCKATHEPSGAELITDAPKDNHGRGESFSPTDLVATALGSCMLTIIGISARTLNLNVLGATASVEKEMTTTPPRKIQRLTVSIHVTGSFTVEEKKKLERAVLTCPVHRSLHPDIEIPVKFSWE